MFKPVRDYLVVEPLEVETQTASGIVLPESSKKGNRRGLVLRVGEGRWNSQNQVFNGFSCDVGDVVLFNEFAGLEIQEDGRDLIVIRDADVIGIFE